MARFNLSHEERIGVCLTEKQRKKNPGKVNSINQHRGKKVWIIGRESGEGIIFKKVSVSEKTKHS